MASGEIISSTGTNLNLVFTWSTARVAGTRTAEATLRAYIQFTSLDTVGRASQPMVIGGESHTFGTSAISDYTGSIHRVQATTYSDSGSNRKTFTYDDNGNLASQSLSGSWIFNGTFGGTYIGTIYVSGNMSFDSIEPANTAPVWGSAVCRPSANGYIPETQTTIYVDWDAATDPEGNLTYTLQRSVSYQPFSIIYTGTARNFTDNVGAGEDVNYTYAVSVHDGYVGASDKPYIYSGVIGKNTFTPGALNTVSTIGFTETIGYNALSWSAGSNSNGSGMSSYKISCSTSGVAVQNSGVAISTGYQLPIYASGVVPSGPYINISELKTKFPLAVQFQGSITLVLTTVNTYGTSKTSSRSVSIDLRTYPRKASDDSAWTAVVPVVDATDTYSYLIGGTRYYIPNRRSVYISWAAAEDPLGSTITYDLQVSLAGGAYATIASNLSTLYGTYSTPVTSRVVTTFKVIAKTQYSYTQLSAATTSISLDFYDTPSFNNFAYTRTTTTVTVTGTITLNTSIPGGLGSGGTPPTSYAIEYIGKTGSATATTETFTSPTYTFNQTDTHNGTTIVITADTVYTFSITYLDIFITAIFGTARSTSVSILAYNPIMSVRAFGVGINGFADATYKFVVGGKINATEGIYVNGTVVSLSGHTHSYLPSSGNSYIQSTGLSGTWGVTSGVSTGAFNAIMGTTNAATWLLSATSGGVWRSGIQALDSSGVLRFYVGTGYFAFDGTTLNTGAITAAGIITSSPDGGFKSNGFVANGQSPIWRIGGSEGYGLSYFQSAGGIANLDTIGFHFGTATAAGSQFYMRSDGMFRATSIFAAESTYGIYLAAASFSWGGSTQYPSIYSSHADRWVMICNPHVPFLLNGVNGHTGDSSGAGLTMSGDAGSTISYKMGIGANGVGGDKFSLGRQGVPLFYMNNGGLFGMGQDVTGTFRLTINGGYNTDLGGLKILNSGNPGQDLAGLLLHTDHGSNAVRYHIFARNVATTMFYVDHSGNVWSQANISAWSFTDRTPHYSGDALKEISLISDDGKGGIDHKTLPTFAQKKTKTPKTTKDKNNKVVEEVVEEEGRDLGAMISILTTAVQQLTKITEEQAKEIKKLQSGK